MAIIYSYPENTNILGTDILVGTTTTIRNGKPKNQTKSFSLTSLKTFINSSNTLAAVLSNGNTATNNIILNGNITTNSFIKSGGTSSQFLKADGSVDTNMYAIDSNVVHKTGDEVINGVKSFNSTPKFNSSEIKLLDVANGNYASIIVQDNGFTFKNYLGNNQFYIEGGLGFGAYKTPAIRADFLLASLTASRSYTIPNTSGTIALEETIKPYKVYTALLSQTGTNPPTAIVLENTLGAITFSYSGVGQYQINSAGLFTLDKTLLFIQGANDGDINSTGTLNNLYYNTSSAINCITSAPSNGMLRKTSIEIRVYN